MKENWCSACCTFRMGLIELSCGNAAKVTCSNWAVENKKRLLDSILKTPEATSAAQRAVHLFIQSSVKINLVHWTLNWIIGCNACPECAVVVVGKFTYSEDYTALGTC